VRRIGRLLPVLVAGALIAGCGGDDESDSSTQLENPPMTVPGGSADESRTDSTESTDTAPSGESGGGSTTGPMDQPNPGNGGVPAPDSNNPPPPSPPEDSPSNDTPPEPGSPAERFEQFCAQNPGAC